jgi:iron complex outermembrane recepter protein
LGDKIAFTVAGERRTHGDFIKNVTPNANAYTPAMFPVNNAGGVAGAASFLGTPAETAAVLNSGLVAKEGHVSEDFWAVSGKLLFRPSDSFKITFAGDYSKKDDDTGNSGYNTTPAYPVGVLAAFLGPPPVGLIGSSTTPALLSSFVVPITEDFTTAQRGAGFAKLKDWGVSATAVLELGGVDITSITSYRKNKSEFLTELGSHPFAMLEAHVPLEKKTFYQELRAVSTGDGPLSWIAGASYLRAQFDGGLFTTIVRPIVIELPSGSGGYVTKNWSGYAQLGYDLTDQLNVTVSGRYVDEKNNARSLNPLTGNTDRFTLSESKFLPSATISYKLDGGGNIYARWARGFKAGGIVPVVPVTLFPDPFSQGSVFKGEVVDSYEVGLRAPLMNNRVQVTAAAFYNDYRNVQVAAHARNELIPGTTLTYAQLVSIAVVNAGSARTYGAEGSVTARVADPLTLGASVGYLNAKYKSLTIPATNPVLDPLNLSGTRMINSPEWQFSFNADLDQPITEGLHLVGNAVAAYTDEVLWQAAANPFLPDAIGKSYWLVNARLGIKSADSNWELAVYAKNLFNQGYSTFGNSSSSYGNILLWGDPRVIGVEGIFKF